MIQRISPPLLTVQGRGNQRAHIRGAVKKGKELRGRRGRNIKETERGAGAMSPTLFHNLSRQFLCAAMSLT